MVKKDRFCEFANKPGGTSVALRRASACGLRQGAVNAGGSQVDGLGRGVFGRPDRNFHQPRLNVVMRPPTRPQSHPGTFRIFQREFQLPCERVSGCSCPLPGTVGLEPQVPYSATPGGDDTPNRPEVGPVSVLLIQSSY